MNKLRSFTKKEVDEYQKMNPRQRIWAECKCKKFLILPDTNEIVRCDSCGTSIHGIKEKLERGRPLDFGCIHHEKKDRLYILTTKVRFKEEKPADKFLKDLSILLERVGYELLEEKVEFIKEDT